MITPDERQRSSNSSHLLETPPYRRGAKSRHGGTSYRGKLSIIVIFFLLRAMDALMYFGTPMGNKSRLLSAIITTAIWTSVLLVAIWNRQNWARYLLILIFLLGVASSMIFVPAAVNAVGEFNHVIGIMMISGLLYVAIAWFLISSRDIKRLTSRMYE